MFQAGDPSTLRHGGKRGPAKAGLPVMEATEKAPKLAHGAVPRRESAMAPQVAAVQHLVDPAHLGGGASNGASSSASSDASHSLEADRTVALYAEIERLQQAFKNQQHTLLAQQQMLAHYQDQDMQQRQYAMLAQAHLQQQAYLRSGQVGSYPMGPNGPSLGQFTAQAGVQAYGGPWLPPPPGWGPYTLMQVPPPRATPQPVLDGTGNPGPSTVFVGSSRPSLSSRPAQVPSAESSPTPVQGGVTLSNSSDSGGEGFGPTAADQRRHPTHSNGSTDAALTSAGARRTDATAPLGLRAVLSARVVDTGRDVAAHYPAGKADGGSDGRGSASQGGTHPAPPGWAPSSWQDRHGFQGPWSGQATAGADRAGEEQNAEEEEEEEEEEGEEGVEPPQGSSSSS